jgi:DNA repair ATPase RecN
VSSTQTSTSSRRHNKSPVQGIQESLKDVSAALQAVAAKLLNDGDSEDKALDQLEKVERLRRSYQELPENTEDERKAKHRHLEYLAKMEEKLLGE